MVPSPFARTSDHPPNLRAHSLTAPNFLNTVINHRKALCSLKVDVVWGFLPALPDSIAYVCKLSLHELDDCALPATRATPGGRIERGARAHARRQHATQECLQLADMYAGLVLHWPCVAQM